MRVQPYAVSAEALAERTGVMLLRMTLPSGEIEYLGGAVERLTGYPASHWMEPGRSLTETVHPDCREAVEAAFARALRGEVIPPLEHALVLPDGRVQWLVQNIVMIHGADGQPCAIEAYAVDSTERRRERLQAERALWERESRSQHAQRLESLGQLTGGVAHGFNNLLQVIKAQTLVGMDLVEDGHPLETIFRDVYTAGERGQRLVGQLLAFSRRQIIRLAAVDLGQIVTATLGLVGPVLGSGVRLHWDPPAEPVVIRADVSAIEQVIMNLCLNARDAMPEGGELWLRLSTVEHAGASSGAPPLEPGTYAVLEVRDDGVGIEPDHLPRIFEPFFSTKAPEEGTGLGLATVYGTVRQHGGHVEVSSVVEEGTSFRLFVPCTEAPVERPPAPSREAQTGEGTIMLVEDDELVRRVTAAFLRRAGYRVITAEDGLDAVQLAETHGHEVDLAVFDVMMARMSGPAAVEQIRKRHPDFPVLFTSGYAKDGVHVDFVQPLDVDYLQKPYAPDTLLARIRAAIAKRRRPD